MNLILKMSWQYEKEKRVIVTTWTIWQFIFSSKFPLANLLYVIIYITNAMTLANYPKRPKKTSKKQWHLYFDTIIILKVLWNSIILCMWFVYQEVKYVVLETTVWKFKSFLLTTIITWLISLSPLAIDFPQNTREQIT